MRDPELTVCIDMKLIHYLFAVCSGHNVSSRDGDNTRSSPIDTLVLVFRRVSN